MRKMSPTTLPALLIVSGLLCSAAALSPQLTSGPARPQFVAPGYVIPAAFGLPKTGRALLWVMPGLYALEDRDEFPAATYDASAPANIKDYNPLTPVATVGKSASTYLLFSSEGVASQKARRAAITARFPGVKVLFDDGDNLQPPGQKLGPYERPKTTGLYLLDGGKVVGRYSGPSGWKQSGVTPMIAKAAADFLRGGTLQNVPLPLGTPGSAVSSKAVNTAPAQLWLSVNGQAALAPKDSLKTQTVGGVTVTSPTHPGASSRFALEQLSPLLKKYGVQGVAFVLSDFEQLPKLQAAFPGWKFIALNTPQKVLEFTEVSPVSATVIKGGKVVGQVNVWGDSQGDTSALESLLRTAGK